jgi:Fur family ferric uptake transcriptional regulator
MPHQLETLFSHHGLKITDARSALVTILRAATAPLCYEQMKQQLLEPMDKATFYRNMAKFETLGLVHKFESDDRKWYFELARSTHAHFICEECHQITCMDVHLGEVEGDVKSIVLKGRCKECKT